MEKENDPVNLPEIERRLQPLRVELLRIKQQLEVAEACAEAINPVVAQVASLGLAGATVFVGPQVASRYYPPRPGSDESSLTICAALLVPGGLGVVVWDSEVYADTSAEELEAGAGERFIPFEMCIPADRARLLSQIDPLLEKFLNTLELRDHEAE